MPAMDGRTLFKQLIIYFGFLLAAAGVFIEWAANLGFGLISPQLISRVIWLGIGLGLVWVLYDARIRLWAVFRANPFFWLLLFLAVASVAWSVAPAVSARRVVLLGIMFLIGTALASTLAFDAGIRVLQAGLATLVLGSVLVAWFMPEVGVHSPGYGAAWKGVFSQKNWLGNAAALWGVLCFALALSAKNMVGVAAALSTTLVAVLVMWKSNSVASYFGFAAGVLVLLSVWLVQRGWLKVGQLAALFLVCVSMALVFHAELFRLFGRNETLTGRWDIWRTLWPIMLERPLLGYGYDAYLHMDGVMERLGRWRNMLATGGDTHNGFVRLQLDMGIIGVLLGGAMFAHLFWRVVGWVRRYELNRPRYIATGLWTVIFLHQIAEPSMSKPISLSIVLLIYTSLISFERMDSRAS